MSNTSDEWILSEAEWHNELPIIIRLRDKIDKFIQHEDFGIGFRITWKFEHPNKYGYPTTQDNDQLEVFEEAIYDAIERNTPSIFTSVVTNNGERDWCIYTSDPDAVFNTINRSLAELPRFPISFSSGPDPEWSEYHGLKSIITNDK